MVRDKYEISLWEDYLVDDHYEEKKIAVIGSDTLTSDCRAIEPKLVENINGTHTFTFRMFYVYRDDNNEIYQNPFLNLLVNERKVKVLWKNEWYDFIIKSCQEDSGSKSITYTCTDLFINELSKTGFDIVLDAELKNNQGTPVELARTVLEGTDWVVDEANSDIIKQEKEEPVYEVTLSSSISAHNDTDNTSQTVASGKLVLVFYDQVEPYFDITAPTTADNFQFAYADSYSTDTNSQLVVNAKCYSFKAYISKEDNQIIIRKTSASGTIVMTIPYASGVSSNYRASRLIKTQKSAVDPITGKCCGVYKLSGHTGADDDEYYGFQSVEYNDPTAVNNLFINSKDFVSTEGWEGSNLRFMLYPVYTDASVTYESSCYLKLSASQTYSNRGVTQSSNFIPNGFTKGQKYIFRYKAKSGTDSAPSGSYVHTGITFSIKGVSGGQTVTYFNIGSAVTRGDWTEFTCTCSTSIKRIDLYTNDVRFYLTIGSSLVWIEEVQFFPFYEAVDGNGNTQRINPGEMDLQSISTTYYVYYNHTDQMFVADPKDIVYSYKDTTPDPSMVAVYNNNFEKIRSITAKQSNRFNILQSIAQTFECWIRFTIEHDQSTGRILYEDGKPKKYVTFKKDIGREVGVGFVYGIDLKTIQRTIQSEQIVTKTIVSQNSNEFALNGFCTIARSIENYPRTNFVLNFDYYVSQGLLNAGELKKDLYNSTGNAIGYYYWLNKYNKEYDSLTDKIVEKESELLKQESYLTVYDGMITSIQQQIADIENELMAITGKNTWTAAVAYINNNKTGDTKLKGQIVTHDNLLKSKSTYETMKAKLSISVGRLTTAIDGWKTEQKSKLNLIKAKHLEFYTKYSRFIQEGSWISEDYVDDNLYYLDALSVAYTSSRPQISYNISVLRLSALDEFKNKVFHLGDISFIQDTEFFGYTRVTKSGYSVLTPYKEKVLVSEITSYFDEPEKDNFKVQNYKTQFEDLFQRITSTTQSLQYASGEYARAASIVETDGTIKVESLQASFAVNEQLVYSAKNDTVSWDSTGVSVVDATNPNKQTKVTSGGVFITTDGGVTWKNAVRGDGIATQYLTSGSINTENINIISGSFPTFRWDQNGINAYKVENGNFYFNTAVRYDQFGIYGIRNYAPQNQNDSSDASNFVPANENEIWTSPYVRFGLTWKGFFLRNEDSSVEISSENDIVVTDGTYNRVKIGRISGSSPNYLYGIQISNSSGNPVLVTGSDGNLWLKNTIKVGAGNTSTVDIGYNSSIVRENTQYHEVFHAGERNGTNEFIVYEDGYLKASGGTFTGEIYATSGRFEGEIVATSGTIGNVTIGEFTKSAYKVVITSDNGTTFKKQNGSATPSSITLTATLYKGDAPITSGVTYAWYINNSETASGTSRTILVNPVTFTGDDVKVYRCDVQYSG